MPSAILKSAVRLSILVAWAAWAAPAWPEANLSVEQAILERANQLMTAMERQDRRALERLTAPSFALRSLGGDPEDVTSRKEWIDNAMKKRWRHNGYENVSVLVRGNRAVMLSTLNFSPPASGIKPRVSTASALVDVWQFQNGEWRATGRYAGRWSIFKWLDRLAGFVLGGAVFGVVGWALGPRKRGAGANAA